MPISKEPGKYGNLRVKYEMAFPQNLSDAQRQALKQAL